MHRHALKIALLGSALMFMGAGSVSAADEDHISFKMVAANACLPDAKAKVQIISDGQAEDMFIVASGLPPNTAFDFFVIQVPKAPFGLSWYQGDMQSDDDGDAVQHFRGRFSIETFIVAPGSAPAPKVFDDNATTNPATPPVQIYHLGLWFNSPTDASRSLYKSLPAPRCRRWRNNHLARVENPERMPASHRGCVKTQAFNLRVENPS